MCVLIKDKKQGRFSCNVDKVGLRGLKMLVAWSYI